MSKTFKERYLSHEIELEAIDDYTLKMSFKEITPVED